MTPTAMRRTEWLFAALLLALAFGYAFFTAHVWEDYFITFRHSENLAEGRGLVYHEGERIHGFTSPIGVLLPAAFHWVAGNPESYLPALWMFRIVSALAYAGAGVLLLRLIREAAPNEPLLPLAGAIFFAVEFKSLAFTMNGQETAFMLLFLAWTLRCLQLGAAENWKQLGLAWAGLQWTRPDGCVFVAATALAMLVFPGSTRRRDLIGGFLKAGVLSLLLYSPWLVGTTLYYGTPIPHTVAAKAGTVPLVKTLFGPFPFGFLDRLRDRAGVTFEPIYAVFGGWPDSLVRFTRGVGVLGLVWWLFPFHGPTARWSRLAGLSAFLMVVYFHFVLAFPWYAPPVALLMIASLVWGAFAAPRTLLIAVVAAWLFVEMWDKDYFARLDDGRLPFKPKEAWIFLAAVASAFLLPKLFDKSRSASRTAFSVVVGVSLALGVVAACSWRQIAVQQESIENLHRRAIGEWLRANMQPGETIFLESLGYIGYFSNGKMLDWPGLVAPEVVAARRRGWKGMVTATAILEPDWLVFRRKHEFEEAANVPWIMDRYEIVKEFNDGDALKRTYPNLPGLGYLLNDADHVVLHKRRRN